MNCKTATRLVTAALIGALSFAYADPVEEIDLTAVDDTAEAAEKKPTVARTNDGMIDVACEDATISSILQQFRRATRMNILSGDSTNLNRKVSASLNHVPWTHALESILGMANFKMEERNGMWFVSEKTEEEVKNATRHYALKHASAVDLADLFNGVTVKTSYADRNSIRNSLVDKSDSGSPLGAAKDGGEAQSALAGRAKATAFPNTNILVLTGPEANLNECEKIINELDRPITQVYIEARFLELSTQAMHKLGVQWDQLQSWRVSAQNIKAGVEANGGKIADYGMVQNQKSINNNTTGNSNKSIDAEGKSTTTESKNSNLSENSTYNGIVPNAIGEAVGAGASAASMAWRNASTFSGQLSAQDFDLAISAFEQLEEGKLFSNPRIIVANGKEAKVDMTTKEPNVEVKSSRSGNDGQSLDISTKLETIPGNDRNLFAGEAFFSYGISLTVKPRVSSTGLISVEVVPTISEKEREKSVAGAGQDAVYTTYPVIGVKTINTEFTIKDGATAVIGGLTRTTETDVDSGIPYLRKIPWIGPKIFGWKSREKVQTEILVCVTVGIANPETLRKDAGLPTNAVLGREYVEGRRFEPGNRPDALKNITNIDTRSIEEIRENPYQTEDGEIDLEDKSAKPDPAKQESNVDLEDGKR